MASVPGPGASLSPEELAEYRGRVPFNIAVAFLVIDVAIVALRFYARTKVQAPLAAEDYLTIPALVLQHPRTSIFAED